MKVVIVGAGVIGANLAQSLSAEQHEVYLIESRADTAMRVDERIDAKVITGDGADPDVLKKAPIDEADLVIAVTASDEVNLIVCALAAAFGSKRRIARVRSRSLSRMITEFGLHFFHIDELINPEEVAAEAIVKTIQAPGAREVADFSNGRLLLRTFEIPPGSGICGVPLGELRDEDFPWPFLVIALIQNGEVIIPKGDTRVDVDDRIYVLLPASSLGEFLSFVDPSIRKAQKAVIYGATEIGERVARGLTAHLREILLIEENEDNATAAAGRLEDVRIINGSASESAILGECGIEAADAFIATSANDHSNLISAVLAKKLGAKYTTIITQQPDYLAIGDALNIDAIINPRLLAVDQILRLARGRNVQTVTKLIGCDAEAVEFFAEEGAPVTKGPLKELSFPKQSIVGAICRGDEVILAKGDTQIHPRDRVIVFCRENAVKKMQAMFVKKKLL